MSAYLSKIIGNTLGVPGQSTLQPGTPAFPILPEGHPADPLASMEDQAEGKVSMDTQPQANRDDHFQLPVHTISMKKDDFPVQPRGPRTPTGQLSVQGQERTIHGQNREETVSTREKNSVPGDDRDDRFAFANPPNLLSPGRDRDGEAVTDQPVQVT